MNSSESAVQGTARIIGSIHPILLRALCEGFASQPLRELSTNAVSDLLPNGSTAGLEITSSPYCSSPPRPGFELGQAGRTTSKSRDGRQELSCTGDNSTFDSPKDFTARFTRVRVIGQLVATA